MTNEIVVVRGTGSIGRRHLRTLGTQPGVAPVAYPVRPERVTALRAEGFQAVANLRELNGLARCAIIATDTARHISDATELLALGDLLVEKPLAPTTAGLAEFAQQARESKRRIWVAFCFRFDPSLERFAELLPNIGIVDSVRIECQSYLPDWRPADDHRHSYSARAAEGGVLRDLSHEIDYATKLFGRPKAVIALLTRTGRLDIESEESADLMWLVENGPIVSLRLDYLSRVTRRRMRAVGSVGELEWDAVQQTVALRVAGADEQIQHLPCTRDELFQRQAAAFISACRGEPSESLATFEEGAFVAALTDAAHRSTASGRAESIRGHTV